MPHFEILNDPKICELLEFTFHTAFWEWHFPVFVVKPDFILNHGSKRTVNYKRL